MFNNRPNIGGTHGTFISVPRLQKAHFYSFNALLLRGSYSTCIGGAAIHGRYVVPSNILWADRVSDQPSIFEQLYGLILIV